MNIQDQSGQTALYTVANLNDVESVKILLAHKHINVNTPNKTGQTPLNLAIIKHRTKLL